MDVNDFFSFGNPGASKSAGKSDTTKHNEFFRFLSICCSLKVTVLPLVWRSSLESLGEGATGQISQAALNARDLLAFKRFAPWRSQRGLSKAQFRSDQYEAFVSEMTALQCGPLATHPNIVNLEGLCWEITSDADEVLPVLVYRQAQCDLEEFLSLSEGLQCSVNDRMLICGEIARALKTIHSCGALPLSM